MTMAMKDLYSSAFMEEKIIYNRDDLQVLQQRILLFSPVLRLFRQSKSPKKVLAVNKKEKVNSQWIYTFL